MFAWMYKQKMKQETNNLMSDFKLVILNHIEYVFLLAQSVEQRTELFLKKIFVSSRLTGGIYGVGYFI